MIEKPQLAELSVFLPLTISYPGNQRPRRIPPMKAKTQPARSYTPGRLEVTPNRFSSERTLDAKSY